MIVLLVWGIFTLVSITGGGLPPTSMQGHTERLPAAHILKKPFPIEIQKHMLEHADGEDGGPPGVIINYDCKKYDCEPDLIEKLEAFAIKYPANVYVAPFKNMDEKIALTKLGRIQTLEAYDETVIDNFINGF